MTASETPVRQTAEGRIARAAGLALFAALLALMPVLAADISSKTLIAGRTLGLWALLLLALQPITALRIRPLERAFGQDRLLAFHRWCGTAALTFAFLHPLVVYGPDMPLAGPSGPHFWREGLGALALFGLWTAVVPSLARSFVCLSWEAWKRLHVVAALVTLPLAFVHALTLAQAMREGWRLAAWGVLLTLWAGIVVWKKTSPWHRDASRHLYKVTEIRPAAEGVTELTLAPGEASAPLRFRPGQFAYLRLKSAVVPNEEHPFTLAAAPAPLGTVQFAVKALGDYTSQLGKAAVGDTALLYGPFGRFTPAGWGQINRLVLIAGGIGVTPLLSVLRTMAAVDDPPPITLIWLCRRASEMPYREVLEALCAARPPFVFHPLFTQEGGHRPDVETLAALLPPYSRGTHAMVCGPDGLMRSVRWTLRRSGYPRRTIHAERFRF